MQRRIFIAVVLGFVFVGLLTIAGLFMGCDQEEEPTAAVDKQVAMAPAVVGGIPDNPSSEDIGPLPPSAVPLKPAVEAAPVLKAAEVAVLPSLEVTLMPGDCVTEEKSVDLLEAPPKGDVLFAFDLTGSMGSAINTAKTEAVNIMTAISGVIADSNFGVVSAMDYVGYFEGCGYTGTYGSGGGCGDYPYSLDQAITGDTTAVDAAINGLVLGCGADGPEDYTRVMYESYSDSGIGWRDGAKRFLVYFLDSVPHSCDVYLGGTCGAYEWTTGPDPGPDAIANNGDDLELADVLAGLAGSDTTLIVIDAYGWYTDLWNCYADQVSEQSGAFPLSGGGGDIADYIASLIEEALQEISEVTVEVCTPGYEDWLVDVSPPAYYDVEPPVTLDFDLEICVPEDTEPGMYCFDICIVGDGAEYARQEVCIEVIPAELDIKPGSCPNPLNVNSKGVLPVGIVGKEDFDPTVRVIPETVKLEGVPAVKWEMLDSTEPVDADPEDCYDCFEAPDEYMGDGLMDFVFYFDTQAIAEAIGSVDDGQEVVLTLTGTLDSGSDFAIQDCVIIIKKK